MASNEIIVRIVVDCAAFTIGFITTILAFKLALARSAAAHKRELAEKDGERKGLLKANESLANDNTRLRGELAAKDDERLTIVANYETVIAAKDREIAELRDNLKVAEDALRKLQERLVASVHDGTIDPHDALQIAENALAAIREEGGAE